MMRRKVLGIGANSATMLVDDDGVLKILKRINVSSWEADEVQRLTDVFLMLSKVSDAALGAKASQQLLHVDNVTVQNAFVNILLEYCPQGNLADAVAERAEPPTDLDIAGWALCAADALQNLHDLGYCHHDVQLSNCYVSEDGSVKLGIPTTERMYWERFDDSAKKSDGALRMFPPEVRARRLFAGFSSDVWHLGQLLEHLLDGIRGTPASRSSHIHNELRKLTVSMMQDDVPCRPSLSVVRSVLQRLASRSSSSSASRFTEAGQWQQHAEAQLRELEACQQLQQRSSHQQAKASPTVPSLSPVEIPPLHPNTRATTTNVPSQSQHVDVAAATRKSMDFARGISGQQELRNMPKHKRMEALDQMSAAKMQRQREFLAQKAERNQQRVQDHQAAQQLQKQHREQMRSIRQSRSKIVEEVRRKSKEESAAESAGIQIFVKGPKTMEQTEEKREPSHDRVDENDEKNDPPRDLRSIASPPGSSFWLPTQQSPPQHQTHETYIVPAQKRETPTSATEAVQRSKFASEFSMSPDSHPRPPLEDASPPPRFTQNVGSSRVANPVLAKSTEKATPSHAGIVRSMAVLEWYVDTLKSSIKSLMDPPVFEETMSVVQAFASSTTRDRVDPARNADFLSEVQSIVGDQSVMQSAIPLFCQLVALESALRMSQDLEAATSKARAGVS